jgi:transposase
VTAQIGWMYSLRGASQEGLALIQPLVEQLERGGAPRALPAIYTTWGQLLFAAGRYDASLAANERALAQLAAERHAAVAAIGYAHGDTEAAPQAGFTAPGDSAGRTLVRAAFNRLVCLLMLGRLADALRAGQEVLPLAEAAGHPHTLLGVLRDLSYIHALRGDLAASRACIERAGTLAGEMADPGPAAYTMAQRAWVIALAGDWPAARTAMDAAVALGRQANRSWYSPYPLIFGAWLSLAEGDRTATAVALADALTLAEETADLQSRRWAATTMAELEILEGRPDLAHARLVPVLDRPGLEECDVTTLLPVLAWAHLEQGQIEQAAGTVEQALARARPEGMRLVLVEALRVQALVALRRERWDEAARSLGEGLALAREMPYPYVEARLLQLNGLLHLQQSEPEGARERLEAARAIFARLGARRDLERVKQALVALSQQQATGELGLTDAQWAQVAVLLPPRRRGRGRPRADDRRTLEAILYQRRTGCAWADLPAVYGDEATAHRRWQEWQATGLWERIAAIVPAPPSAVEGRMPAPEPRA